MNKYEYKIINNEIKNSNDAIKGKDIFYKCLKCNDIVSSVPKDNINCKCFNIGIDKDLNRLFVEDYKYFVVLRKVLITKMNF